MKLHPKTLTILAAVIAIALAGLAAASVISNRVTTSRTITDDAMISNERLDAISRAEFPELTQFDGPLRFTYDPTAGLFVRGQVTVEAAPDDATTLEILNLAKTETTF